MMASTSLEDEMQKDKELKERLRTQLKSWERAFQKQHGHKPTPDDVKADSDINAKYKLYHKAFRAKSSSRTENVRSKTEYVSTAHALKQITPHKRTRADENVSTPAKEEQISDNDVEIVGPTPQLNGRILGLFDGIHDPTPLAKRRKLDWGEQLAEARRNSPAKATPRKRALSSVFHPEYFHLVTQISNISSPMQETPSKSTSSFPSRYTTPVTQPSPVGNHHVFATPAFLRPTALPIQSPQSPSLPWERLPTTIKGLSALISDFRANQQEGIEEVDHESWQDDDDDDELRITQEHESPGVAGRKPWIKKGAKRSKRRVISINALEMNANVSVRPVPELEVPASDDEPIEPMSPTTSKSASKPPSRNHSPELGDEFQDEEEPSDLEDARDRDRAAATQRQEKKPKKTKATRKAKGGYTIGKQVSGNFVSYKIRSKGQRGRGRGGFGGGRFRRR